MSEFDAPSFAGRVAITVDFGTPGDFFALHLVVAIPSLVPKLIKRILEQASTQIKELHEPEGNIFSIIII
jgi:hypothetical protein